MKEEMLYCKFLIDITFLCHKENIKTIWNSVESLCGSVMWWVTVVSWHLMLSQPQEATTSDIQWPRHKVSEPPDLGTSPCNLSCTSIEHTPHSIRRSPHANKMLPIKKTLVPLSPRSGPMAAADVLQDTQLWCGVCHAGMPGSLDTADCWSLESESCYTRD